MTWLFVSLNWYLYLLLFSLVFFSLTKKVFSSFFDFGYPFAKIFSLLLNTYLIFLFSSFKILSFSRLSIFFIFFILLIINLFFLKNGEKINKRTLIIILFEEVLFFISFLFWIFVRGQEPSIRGLEKFMDFGFINSILKTKFFPPLDIWLSTIKDQSSSFFINYYYFGHLIGAFLIKLINIDSAIGYNLILATIFALGITETFSLVFNLAGFFLKNNRPFSLIKTIFIGLLGSFIVNLGGNLHTIYTFTRGYPNEKPIPFWQVFSWCNSYFPNVCQKLNQTLYSYWYPNATRFIPFTIHEFPSYSYVVADLHGHVFDIPFVLLTLALLLKFFIIFEKKDKNKLKKWLPQTIFFGFLAAIHYMTNAFDGPIYLLLIGFSYLYFFSLGKVFLSLIFILITSFIIYSLPFSYYFSPFVSGIGVNCSPEILTFINRIGPFLFEKDNCQISPLWMLFLLWGFFWINFLIFLNIKKRFTQEKNKKVFDFVTLLFSFSTFLIIIPEFFYIKDIYPAHFRANTMFKLGYQAFIMMGISSAFVFLLIKKTNKKIFLFIYYLIFILVAIYPFFSIPSYYGQLKKTPQLDGSNWLKETYPEDKEIIDWLNKNIKNQPTILEAQGDSYTDYQRISAYTGLPTVAGWWVHEWLWRGSSDAVGKRIPDIVNIYESNDLKLTDRLLKKYQIKYVIISMMEKQKYPNINQLKFEVLGKKVFETSNKNGVIYQVK